MLREGLVERGALRLRHLVVVRLLLGVWTGRRVHTLLGGIHGFLVSGSMVLLKHLPEEFHICALPVLLDELAHLHLREVPLNGFG